MNRSMAMTRTNSDKNRLLTIRIDELRKGKANGIAVPAKADPSYTLERLCETIIENN